MSLRVNVREPLYLPIMSTRFPQMVVLAKPNEIQNLTKYICTLLEFWEAKSSVFIQWNHSQYSLTSPDTISYLYLRMNIHRKDDIHP